MQFELRSNLGDESFTLERACGLRAEEPRLVANLHLRGQHWDGDHELPVDLRSEGLQVELRGLERGLEFLERWLHLPLEELVRTRLEGVIDLGRQLKLEFGERPDVISDGHPVVTACFDLGRMTGEVWFVTDQSCVRLFCEAARSTLAESCGLDAAH